MFEIEGVGHGPGAAGEVTVAVSEVSTSAPVSEPSDPGLETMERAARMPLERLEDEITRGSADLAAATCRWLLFLGELDRREGWAGWGLKSCADWLSWRCGIDIRTAREHVRVARGLADLPVIRAAFSRGELSYSKARALTRVATAESESDLCELGLQATASQLDRMLSAHRRVSRARANDRHAQRELHVRTDADGMTVIHARLSPEDGALVVAALDATRDGSAEPSTVTRADALVVLAETALADGARPATGGDRTQVVVHVDVTSGRCHLEDGPALAPETARRLACDSSVVSVTTNGDGTPLSVGRRTRTVPAAIRRALQVRDGGCRFPGCRQRRYVDAHHVQHWSHGGETSLENLVLLCRRHHRTVHEEGFTLRLVDGHHVEVHRPDGKPIPHDGSAEPSSPPPDPDRPIHTNRTHDVSPGAWTATARDGGPLDLDWAAAVIFPIIDREN